MIDLFTLAATLPMLLVAVAGVVSTATRISWPHNWTPRPQHVELFRAVEAGILRICLVVHRRWGKSCVAWNLVIKRALSMPGTLHIYCGPTWSQVSQIIWT